MLCCSPPPVDSQRSGDMGQAKPMSGLGRMHLVAVLVMRIECRLQLSAVHSAPPLTSLVLGC